MAHYVNELIFELSINALIVFLYSPNNWKDHHFTKKQKIYFYEDRANTFCCCLAVLGLVVRSSDVTEPGPADPWS